jgi:hypothetical protein
MSVCRRQGWEPADCAKPYRASKARFSRLTNGSAWNAVAAFANCGRAVAHVRGSYVPRRTSQAVEADYPAGRSGRCRLHGALDVPTMCIGRERNADERVIATFADHPLG